MAAADLTPARLRELFSYDPESGLLTWAVNRGPAKVGDTAGIVGNRGHIKVKVHGKCYQGHRIIWAIVTGEWPAGEVDHIDACKTNNRWTNLRLGDDTITAQNIRRARKNSKTGVLGVLHSTKRPGQFDALIKLRGKNRLLGTWPTADEAYSAYVAAKREMHVGCTL